MRIIITLFITLNLNSCTRNYKVTYLNHFTYNETFLDTFLLKINNLPQDNNYKLDFQINRFSNLENMNAKKIFVKGFKKHEYSNKNDSIEYLGFYNYQKSKIQYFIDKNDYITCLYIALSDDEKTSFLTVDINIVDSEYSRNYIFKDGYILVKDEINHSYDVIDETVSKPVDIFIKYKVIQIKDNRFYFLNKVESKITLQSKFKEELGDKYKIK
jgi:hypothetical protein